MGGGPPLRDIFAGEVQHRKSFWDLPHVSVLLIQLFGQHLYFLLFFFFYCATADLFTVAPTLQDFGRMTATWCHCMQDVCDLTSGRILLHMLARFLQGSHATSLLQGRDECSRAVKRRWEKTEWIQRLCFLKVAAWKISEWTAAKHESMYVNLENIQKTLSCVTNYCHCYCN